MSQVAEIRTEEATTTEMMNMRNDLFKEWLVDLTFEEKKIWLWNASVEMLKIRRRREP